MTPNEIKHYQQNNEQEKLIAEIVSLRAEIVSLRAENVSLRAENQRQSNQLYQNEPVCIKILIYLPDKETPNISSFNGSIMTLKQFKLIINLCF